MPQTRSPHWVKSFCRGTTGFGAKRTFEDASLIQADANKQRSIAGQDNPPVEVLFDQAFWKAKVPMAMGPASAQTASATRETFTISIGKLPGDD
jgi:hypothetical protein